MTRFDKSSFFFIAEVTFKHVNATILERKPQNDI